MPRQRSSGSPDEETPLIHHSVVQVVRSSRETVAGAFFWKLAALSGAAAVAMGAFGAHGLKDRASAAQQQNWATAAQYQVCILFRPSFSSLFSSLNTYLPTYPSTLLDDLLCIRPYLSYHDIHLGAGFCICICLRPLLLALSPLSALVAVRLGLEYGVGGPARFQISSTADARSLPRSPRSPRSS